MIYFRPVQAASETSLELYGASACLVQFQTRLTGCLNGPFKTMSTIIVRLLFRFDKRKEQKKNKSYKMPSTFYLDDLLASTLSYISANSKEIKGALKIDTPLRVLA